MQDAGEVELEGPFNDCTLFYAALFLRFAYRPWDLRATTLMAVQGSLLVLLRLTHKLDAQRILLEVCQNVKGESK